MYRLRLIILGGNGSQQGSQKQGNSLTNEGKCKHIHVFCAKILISVVYVSLSDTGSKSQMPVNDSTRVKPATIINRSSRNSAATVVNKFIHGGKITEANTNYSYEAKNSGVKLTKQKQPKLKAELDEYATCNRLTRRKRPKVEPDTDDSSHEGVNYSGSASSSAINGKLTRNQHSKAKADSGNSEESSQGEDDNEQSDNELPNKMVKSEQPYTNVAVYKTK